MYSERDVVNLVGRIYDSAAERGGWDGFLAELARTAGGRCAAITFHDKQRAEHSVFSQIEVPPEHQLKYSEYYGALDEWALAAPRVCHTGWVGTGQRLVRDEVLARSEFYNDHLRLNNEMFHLCAGVVSMEANSVGACSVLRPKKHGPFGETQLRLLRVLVPHMQQAMRQHQQFVALREHKNLLEAALDRVATAIVFVDQEGRILLENRSAAILLRRRDGLIATRDSLRASNPRESVQLERLIRGAALTGSGKGLDPGGVMEISRENPRPPLAVLVTPMRAGFPSLAPQRPVAAIFVTDPEQKVEPSSEILRRLYGVTPAEYALAVLLVHGRTLRQAADIQHVTFATARSQLKSVFRKLSVSSQSQLVRLLMLLPAFPPTGTTV